MTATRVITNTYALQISNIEYTADGEFATVREIWFGTGCIATRNKIRYKKGGRAYIMKHCTRYFLEEFIRDNMQKNAAGDNLAAEFLS